MFLTFGLPLKNKIPKKSIFFSEKVFSNFPRNNYPMRILCYTSWIYEIKKKC